MTPNLAYGEYVLTLSSLAQMVAVWHPEHLSRGCACGLETCAEGVENHTYEVIFEILYLLVDFEKLQTQLQINICYSEGYDCFIKDTKGLKPCLDCKQFPVE